jgi:hypothetical protein
LNWPNDKEKPMTVLATDTSVDVSKPAIDRQAKTGN